jgi:hypothetical protein
MDLDCLEKEETMENNLNLLKKPNPHWINLNLKTKQGYITSLWWKEKLKSLSL